MSWWRRVIGLDPFDVGLQAVITAILLGWSSATNSQNDAVVIGSMISISSLLVLGIRRGLALHRARRENLTGLGTSRLAELEQRVAELEMDSARLAELEERLDFTERLLASSNERSRELAP